MQLTDVRADVRTQATTTAATLAPALAAMVFGLLVLFCVGFMQVPAVHNGAHDTRHTNGFPCH